MSLAGGGGTAAPSAGFSGAGRFRGRWGGTLDWPVFEGRFEGAGIGYAGVEWGEARWSGLFDSAAEAVTSRPLLFDSASTKSRADALEKRCSSR